MQLLRLNTKLNRSNMLTAVLVVITSVLAFWFWRRRQAVTSVEGKAVFITGCDTGIGHEAALLLDKLGFSVFAGCLYPEGEGACALRSQSSAKLVVVPLDVTNHDQVLMAAQETRTICHDRREELWCVINNAGLCVAGELEWHTWDQIGRLMEVNIMGYLRVIKAFLPQLKMTKGRIVNVSSVNGQWAYPGTSVYCATKFAVEGLSNSLRVELDQYGVQVVVVAPGDYARLTSIMKSHQANAQAQWEALSASDQEIYGDYFWSFHETCLKYIGMGSPPSFQKSPLLNDIQNSVLRKNPQTRYVSASTGLRLFLTFVNFVPSFMADWVLHLVWKSVFPKKPPILNTKL